MIRHTLRRIAFVAGAVMLHSSKIRGKNISWQLRNTGQDQSWKS
jgi:hypothetical protein